MPELPRCWHINEHKANAGARACSRGCNPAIKLDAGAVHTSTLDSQTVQQDRIFLTSSPHPRSPLPEEAPTPEGAFTPAEAPTPEGAFTPEEAPTFDGAFTPEEAPTPKGAFTRPRRLPRPRRHLSLLVFPQDIAGPWFRTQAWDQGIGAHRFCNDLIFYARGRLLWILRRRAPREPHCIITRAARLQSGTRSLAEFLLCGRAPGWHHTSLAPLSTHGWLTGRLTAASHWRQQGAPRSAPALRDPEGAGGTHARRCGTRWLGSHRHPTLHKLQVEVPAGLRVAGRGSPPGCSAPHRQGLLGAIS